MASEFPPFGLNEAQIKALLDGSLKPEEIAGDPATQQQRVGELLHWFARAGNPKWTRRHACELAYYIATLASSRFIDVAAIRRAGFIEGLNVTEDDHACMVHIGACKPRAPSKADPASNSDVQVADARQAAYYRWLRDKATLRSDCGSWVISIGEDWLPALGKDDMHENTEPERCPPELCDASMEAALSAAMPADTGEAK